MRCVLKNEVQQWFPHHTAIGLVVPMEHRQIGSLQFVIQRPHFMRFIIGRSTAVGDRPTRGFLKASFDPLTVHDAPA